MIDRLQVLVVGAGPVGLALALELGRRGIQVAVIEEKDRLGAQPRAKTTNIRTMAHIRRWGLADEVRARSPLAANYPRRILFATRLFGYELARFDNALFGDQQRRDDRFPEAAQWIPQYKIEEVLRDAITELPNVSLSFGVRLTGLHQDEAGVSAELVQDGRATMLKADFVVGADGGRSTTRKLIGVRMEGDHAFMGNFLAVYRSRNLAKRIPLAPAISYWLVNAEAPAVTGPLDSGDTWFFSTQLKEGVEPYNADETRRRIRCAIGEDIDFEVLETDTWSAHRLLADRFRVDRVFLAGDACHLHPPMGGYGMNMGIGDAVDLGWKLAAVLKGWGGAVLLDSYERERRPIARQVIEEAAKNYSFVTHHMVRDSIESDTADGGAARATLGDAIAQGKLREFNAIGVLLGLNYLDSPITIADGSQPLPWSEMTYTPDARPGNLAPHCWLADGRSLYDLFGEGFTLLATSAAADAEPIIRAAGRLAVPVTLVALPDEPGLAALYGADLALIRPDQVVAWRGAAPDGPTAERVLLRLAGRAGANVEESVAA